jgi:hypothetical protein
VFKVAMNVIKTEPDSSGDSSLDGSEDVEEDSLGVMLPDVRLETEVRRNLLLCCRSCFICLTAGLFNLVCGAGNAGKILSACRQHEIQYTK